MIKHETKKVKEKQKEEASKARTRETKRRGFKGKNKRENQRSLIQRSSNVSIVQTFL